MSWSKEWPTKSTTPNPSTDPVAFVEALGDKLGWPKPFDVVAENDKNSVWDGSIVKIID